MSEIKDVFPRDGSSGAGSEYGYSVEARLTFGEPKELCGNLLHKEWKRLKFSKGVIGVPDGVSAKETKNKELVSYSSAKALMWWFISNNRNSTVETRIVKHKIKHSYTETLESVHDFTGPTEMYMPKENA